MSGGVFAVGSTMSGEVLAVGSNGLIERRPNGADSTERSVTSTGI